MFSLNNHAWVIDSPIVKFWIICLTRNKLGFSLLESNDIRLPMGRTNLSKFINKKWGKYNFILSRNIHLND